MIGDIATELRELRQKKRADIKQDLKVAQKRIKTLEGEVQYLKEQLQILRRRSKVEVDDNFGPIHKMGDY